jgi:hypothetical protein
MKWWFTFELISISSMPHFNGLATAKAMKENKKKILFPTKLYRGKNRVTCNLVLISHGSL